MACDSVIMALGTSPNPLLRKATPDLEYSDRGGIVGKDDTVTTMKDGVFAGGDAVMGARTVVEAVAIAKKVAESMDAYMKALPADNTPDPYAGIPVFSTPTSDVLAKQGI